MTEKINTWLPSHDGIMPIRVLQHNLIHAFENLNTDFLSLIKQMQSDLVLDTGISYDAVPAKVKSPSTVFGKIFIQEAFLSFVWCNCFSLTVLYQEAIVKQSRNHYYGNEAEKIDFPLARHAYQLWEYTMSLLQEHTPWDMDLPNPEEYDPKYAELIPKINGLYLTALKLLLAHEFAHIELKHNGPASESDDAAALSIQFEKEADSRAIQLVLAGVTEANKVTTHMGILAGLCCLLFFDSTTKGKTYPDTNERIDAIVALVNPDQQDAMWGFATLAYRLWANHYGIDLEWKEGLASPQQLYEYIKAQVESQIK